MSKRQGVKSISKEERARERERELGREGYREKLEKEICFQEARVSSMTRPSRTTVNIL